MKLKNSHVMTKSFVEIFNMKLLDPLVVIIDIFATIVMIVYMFPICFIIWLIIRIDDGPDEPVAKECLANICSIKWWYNWEKEISCLHKENRQC